MSIQTRYSVGDDETRQGLKDGIARIMREELGKLRNEMRKPFNLAYYISKKMISVTKSADMTLPYGMLLTYLFEHVRVAHPHAFSDDLYLVDHVMVPFSEKRVFRIMPNGKIPRLLTLTPSESMELPSSSSHKEEENDPMNNYMLDPIPYINQLPPIKGG
nr:hypothetical protein [Tanacetum cinerariifolium]